MKKLYFSALLLLLTNSACSQSASFDCTKASTDVEKMICADPQLASLDEQMAEFYKAAIAKDKSRVRKSRATTMVTFATQCLPRCCVFD